MTASRTRSILKALSGGRDDEVARGVLRVFGASSIEECVATYEMVGAAERSALDEAVERLAANAGATFPDDMEADVAPVVRDEPFLQSAGEPVPPQSDLRMQSYRIRRQVLTVGRSYWVEDAAGARIFKIAGKVSFARAFSIRDAQGNLAYTVREKLLAVDPTYVISRDNIEAAIVKRTTTSGAPQDKFEIALQSGGMLHASGNLWQDDGVQIVRDGTFLASIRRQQLVLREIFWATVHRSADQALLLAVAMSIVETDSNRGSS